MAAFWSPEFEIDRRPDGTILMTHSGIAPALATSIPARIAQWAAKTPDAVALAERGADGAWQRLSYAALFTRMKRLGAGLLAAGLGQDTPVLILSENAVDHAVLALAGHMVGVPTAAVSTAYALMSDSHDKLRGIAAQLEPGLVYASDGARYGRAIAAVRGDAHVVVSRNAGAGQGLLSDLERSDTSLAEVAFAALSPDMTTKYLFTSGSTGSPKAVINTVGMLMRNQDMVADCFRFLADHPPVVVDWAPWSHTASGNKVFHMVLCHGGAFYIDEGKPTPNLIGQTLRNLAEVSPTWYFNVPAGYEMLIEAFKADPALAKRFFGKLDMMMYAGAGMAQHIWDDLQALAREHAGHQVLLTSALGATETGPFALMCTEHQTASGNIGVPAKGVTLKLVPMEGKLEARLKSPSITPGYLGAPEVTAAAFDEEGFYRLGDALRPADPGDLARGFYFDGRLAENFKLATGTWVAVGALRAGLVDHFGGLIRDAVILGENREELAALVFPGEGVMARLGGSAAEVFGQALEALAAQSTGSATRVRRMVVLRDPPDLDLGEATDKGSINQRAVIRHRPESVALAYSGARGVKIEA